MSRRFVRAADAGDADHDVVVDPGSAGWTYCGLRVLTLSSGVSVSVEAGSFESLVLPLQGGATVQVDADSFELDGRPSIFEGVSDSLYVPRDTEYRLTSNGGGQVAICTAEAATRRTATYLPAHDVEVEVRGGSIVTRQINNVLGPDVAGVADTLIVVEVLTPHGNTSSFPPHKHDEFTEHETALEEIYYFRVRGDHGFALFRGYAADGSFDDTVTVRDGDLYLVPHGYHGPAYAVPGYDLYYLNVMGGDQRVWRFTDDPPHAPLRAQIDALPPDPRLPMYSAPSRHD